MGKERKRRKRMSQKSVPLTMVLAVVSFLGYQRMVVAQERDVNGIAASGGNQTVKSDLLSHRQVFQSLSKSPLLGRKMSLSTPQGDTTPPASWIDEKMAQYSFVWSSADGIDTGSAFLFPGADPQTGTRYVFGALPDHTIFGVAPVPELNAVRLLDLSTGGAVELPADGRPARLIQHGSSGKTQEPGQAKPAIVLPGIASNIAAAASCLWNKVSSTLSVHSWQDFTNLLCQIASRGSEAQEMYDFGKEVTGCASLGVADCFFTAGDVALFISNASCRPDWVDACINPPSPPQGGGGGALPVIILGLTPFSTAVPGQQFRVQIHAANLVTSGASVVVTGPGCPTTTSCVVPAGVITFIGTDYMNVPLTLSQGNFTIQVLQLGQLSNGWPLSVGAAPGNGGGGNSNTPNLAISGSYPKSVTAVEDL